MSFPAPIDPAHVEALLAPFGSSRTLPAVAYTDPDLFGWEQRELFAGGWLCLGRVDDLVVAGQVRALELGIESVLVAGGADGSVRAFSSVCRHRGHPLVEPGQAMQTRLIRCPYHSWTYRLDGTLRTAPTLTRSTGFDPTEWPLMELRLDTWMGWLFVDLSAAAAPAKAVFGNLAEVLAGYEPTRLRRAARHTYEVAANWKLVVENYHECYHCTSIHPALCEVTPVDSGTDLVPDGLWFGGNMTLKDHAVTMSMTGESGGVRFRHLDPGAERRVLYVGLWPNLLISAHPDYVMTHRLIPLAPDRTGIECDWLFPPEAFEIAGFDPSYATEFWDITNKEDWNACEQVQRGTRNRGFRPGPLSTWEGTIYQFHGILGRAYRGEPVAPPVVPFTRLA